MNNVNVNEQIESFVAEFAKQNKIGKAKVQSLLDKIQALKPARKTRKLTDTSKAIQEEILHRRGNVEAWSAMDLAAQMGVHPVYVLNNIASMEKQGYTFTRSKAEKIPGKPGRVPTLFILNK